jgi:endonuclease-3
MKTSTKKKAPSRIASSTKAPRIVADARVVADTKQISAKLEAPKMIKGETTEQRRDRLQHIYKGLHKLYPDARCELDFTNAYELLTATILSAQCTDVRVNIVMKDLKVHYPNVKALAKADPNDLEEVIKSTGFFRQKAKSLLSMANDVVEKFGAKIPETMEQLTTLRGVGRKTANVVMGNAFGVAEGIAVDTHVTRLSHRMGLSKSTSAEEIEQDLMSLTPKNEWVEISHVLILHGRRVCEARKPKCSECSVADLCPSKGMPGSV